MGKVLGIGVLGIVQLAVFITAALVAALATDRLVLPTTTPGAVVLLAVWFVLGYLLYSTALGFLGALASRQEEASNASTPVTMVAMLSYFVAIFAVIDDPDGTRRERSPRSSRRRRRSSSRCGPPSTPSRPWQIGVSAILTLIGIYVLFTIGARVYAGAVLQFGGRIKLRDAWRSGR